MKQPIICFPAQMLLNFSFCLSECPLCTICGGPFVAVPMILTSARWLCNRSPEDIIQEHKPGYTQLYSLSAEHNKSGWALRHCPCEHIHWNVWHFMLTLVYLLGNCWHTDFFMWLGYKSCSLDKLCYIKTIVCNRGRWILGLTQLTSALCLPSQIQASQPELSCWRWLGLFTCLYMQPWCLLVVWQCFVHWLFNLGPDKVACQTQEKANTPDSPGIYILLCNSPDLFCHRLWSFRSEQQLTG